MSGTGVGWLPAPAEELFGAGAAAEESYEVLTVDVPPTAWVPALLTARDELGCTYFDWLSAVDEPGTGFRVSAHVVALAPVRRLLLRTTVPHEAPVLPTAVDVYAGAAWHERETHEMFGVGFEGHPALDHLLLPETFEGHPLRKDFVLAARVAKAWPGAKEPGDSDHGGPKRRQMLPPGVPDPNEWGPLKGQLPPAPARPARGAARTAGDRPVRRTRTAAEGSASQAGPAAEATGAARPRRMRSASEGSVSQSADQEAPTGAEGVTGETGAAAGSAAPQGQASGRPRRARSASEGSASQRVAGTRDAGPEAVPAAEGAPAEGGGAAAGSAARQKQAAAEGAASQASTAEGPAAEASAAHEPGAPAAGTPPTARSGPRRARSASEGSASQRAAAAGQSPTPPAAPRSSDAPWHHARPAFDEPEPKPGRKPEDDTPDTPDIPDSPDTPDDPEGGPR
ncbi:NADH-quinone oxidoreductase subunit C [Streptomyces kebangsaanensis]|uniref:NADH-quinone oxidoreductase subunit C n=1 Tax=Streptomyces kebangsaanensis TaxID=864058 RepID=A0ABW6L2J1_9ACTN